MQRQLLECNTNKNALLTSPSECCRTLVLPLWFNKRVLGERGPTNVMKRYVAKQNIPPINTDYCSFFGALKAHLAGGRDLGSERPTSIIQRGVRRLQATIGLHFLNNLWVLHEYHRIPSLLFLRSGEQRDGHQEPHVYDSQERRHGGMFHLHCVSG